MSSQCADCIHRKYLTYSFSDQRRTETQPIKIVSTPNAKSQPAKPSASSFEDVQVDDSDDNHTSPPNRKQKSAKSVAYSSHVPKQHNFDQQMLLESMLDDGENDHLDSHSSRKNLSRLAQQNQANEDSNGGFVLLDANEQLTVSEPCRRRPFDIVSPFFRSTRNLNFYVA